MKKLKTKLHKIYTVCSNSFNNKIVAGIILGITIAAGTSVLAEDASKTNGNFLNSIANFFGISNPSSNSPTISAVSKELEAEAKKCATAADGTLGAAIKNATKIHLEIAVVAPPVEELFDGDCFSGLMSIFDLSFAIPSLASIMAAVTQAVIKFAQKQVCRAVKKASSMISDPINKAISKINSLQGLTDSNGLINGMVQQGLDNIDTNLGNEYLAPKASETITVEANAFQLSQSSIENGANSNNSNNSSSNNNSNNSNNINYGGQVSTSLNNNMAALNNAHQVISQNLQRIISLTPLISQAQQRLNDCNNSNNNGNNNTGNNINCSQAQNEYQSLISEKERLELENSQIQNSISQGAYNVTLKNGVVTQGNAINSGNNSTATKNANSSSSDSKSNNNSWFNLDWLTN
jgi:hypothetical protein